jgi:hypothetical protein
VNHKRKAFEEWLQREQGLDATWNEQRKCYNEFPAHLAYKAWLQASTVPPGWTITPTIVKPFRGYVLTAPNYYSAVVWSHERNPANVMYMLAEALLGKESQVQDEHLRITQ